MKNITSASGSVQDIRENPQVLSYFVGLVQADGHMYEGTRNRGKLTIELAKRDATILRSLASYIPCNFSIRERHRSLKVNGRRYERDMVCLSICDRGFRDLMLSCGVPYGSKQDVRPASGRWMVLEDYMRGLFDGDGSVGITFRGLPFLGFVTKSEHLADFVWGVVAEWTGKSRKRMNRNKRDSIFNLSVFRRDAVLLAQMMYPEGCVAIPRKMAAARSIVSWLPPEPSGGRPSVRWSKEEDEIIRRYIPAEADVLLNRSLDSIYSRRSFLRRSG